MARITVEDCTEKVPNRFHLVQMASIRTKQLKKGARALVASEDNKEVVVALREIAAGFIKPDYPGRRREDERPTRRSGVWSGIENDDRRAAADVALDRHLAAEQRDQVAHQREAEPRAAILLRRRLVDLEELVEHELLVVVADADALVLDRDEQLALAARDRGSRSGPRA